MKNYTYIDLDYINEMADGDTGFVIEMINDYKTQMPKYISDLNKALSVFSLEDLKFYSHKLSSSFLMMGARQLADAASKIENDIREGKSTESIPGEVDTINRLFPQVVAELDEELTSLTKNTPTHGKDTDH